MYDIFDTITAISTSLGNAGISVIRVSGKDALNIAKKVFIKKSSNDNIFEPYHFYYGLVKDIESNEILDEALLLYMRSPKSYTGEDVIEIQCHGGVISSVSVLKNIIKAGARLAKEGEFTYRAFLNGKKDLTQAEAIESLIHSKTKTQHDNAFKQLSGYYKNELDSIFNYLSESRLYLEAEINFPEDVEESFNFDREIIFTLENKLSKLKKSYNDSIPLFKGITSLILGKPNVGKSSFLNKILQYERAIVTDIPGTTRDFIEESIIFEGVPLKIIDTAGIRSTTDEVEKIGVERAIGFIPSAKIIFAIFDSSRPFDENDCLIIDRLKDKKDALIFVLGNKKDQGILERLEKLPFENTFYLSLKTGEGFESFKDVFRQKIIDIYSLSQKENFYLTNERHYILINEMLKIINDIKDNFTDKSALLFSISSLLTLYNRLLGKEFNPDELNDIFKKFCIGK
ncbi:MAG: tRNA uridine-5-carboxymethylaminomethyl(34) synthesis GTPase MnmE [Proteobacteria bacterium]|nr:tRNA uridine-5-carboxymethylaminomethyl(34) synthesis GTPase MnmE [Pseudomonadota bacterium]